VRNDTFFKSIPLVLQELPAVRFACLGMLGEAQAEGWLRQLKIEDKVELLPGLPRWQVADWFQHSQVVVSPTTHDGTPNTLLEAMASGCFPVAGDLESLREWISPGVNGALVNPADPVALAQAIIAALRQPELRQQAQAANLQLIAERAEYQRCMRQAQIFCLQLTGSTP
jgi:glycosyltransferase involved in cell wall biosynthesis